LGAFRTLGLSPGVDRATARAAYVAALKDHHPDRHQDDGPGEAEATEASARINEAWDRLEVHYDG
jgi:curved DNA-binding protein CbpA